MAGINIKSSMSKAFVCAICLSGLFVFNNCSKEAESERIVAARVGEEEITFQEFQRKFTLLPQHQPNVTLREARLQHMNYMVDRTHLYITAEREGLDADPAMQSKLAYIEHKEMLKFLFQQEVLDKIPVSDEEAWEEYRRSNIQVKLRHLFADNISDASAYQRRLNSGATFENLAREVFFDSVLSQNGGDLGWVGINDLDPFLADSVYNLRLGHVSAPLRSSHGYHIMKVEDVKYSVFLSSDYFNANKQNYVKSLRDRRARTASSAYVKAIMKGKSVTIKSSVLAEFLEISKTHIPMRRQENPVPVPAVNDYELAKLQHETVDILDKVLVIYDDDSWTVGQFLEKVKLMPPMHRPNVNQQALLTRQIIDMVRDEYLLQEAYHKGIDQNKNLQELLRIWRKELLADEMKKRIRWVEYQQADPEQWQARKTAYNNIKIELPAIVDTVQLFRDVSPDDLNKTVQNIPMVVRDYYIW